MTGDDGCDFDEWQSFCDTKREREGWTDADIDVMGEDAKQEREGQRTELNHHRHANKAKLTGIQSVMIIMACADFVTDCVWSRKVNKNYK